jgi:hypothetical protein
MKPAGAAARGGSGLESAGVLAYMDIDLGPTSP